MSPASMQINLLKQKKVEHQHGRRFIGLENQYGGRDVM